MPLLEENDIELFCFGVVFFLSFYHSVGDSMIEDLHDFSFQLDFKDTGTQTCFNLQKSLVLKQVYFD